MEQAIALLKTTRPTFYRWLRSGKIKGMKAGRQWRFYREDVERFVRGEAPRIELRADLSPFVKRLERRFEEISGGNPRDVLKKAAAGDDEVLRSVMLIIALGVRLGASDIHIAPHIREASGRHAGVLRYRVDGVLHPEADFDARLLPAIAERWKIMADCDVHEKMRPQDGRVLVEIEGREIDLRVNFLAASHGESITARILDRDAVKLSLDRIDYCPADREKLLKALHASCGMIVITGPTGCGKSTALYAVLNGAAGPDVKTITVENPVEYYLPWAVQVEIRPQAGLTFPAAMRSALRADPDIILVGEIRDLETLMIADQASLTGHLVLTTLHAADAVGALVRMVEMGSDPFIVGDATRLSMSQRLVRKLCPTCSIAAEPPRSLLELAEKLAVSGGIQWNALKAGFRKAVGCPACAGLGFKSRTVISEILPVTAEIGGALRRRASADEIRETAVAQGMTTMAADGIRRAASGETTLEEVFGVLGLGMERNGR